MRIPLTRDGRKMLTDIGARSYMRVRQAPGRKSLPNNWETPLESNFAYYFHNSIVQLRVLADERRVSSVCGPKPSVGRLELRSI